MSCSCGTTERYTLEIIDIIKHDDLTYSFDLKGDLNTWHEGDSSKVYLKVGENEVARKFSYASLADEKIIRFTTRIRPNRSDYKTRLLRHEIGDKVEISNPTGDFRLKRDNRPVVCLSNGVGIAAARTFIKAFEQDSTGIPEFIQMNVDRSSAIYFDELKLIEEKSAFKSVYLKSREHFFTQLDAELQTLMNTYKQDPYLYIVGSDAFVLETRAHLKSVGFVDEDILIEKHILSSESCGCGPDSGCGCGANIIKTIGGFKLKSAS